jgi:hypothetical protein
VRLTHNLTRNCLLSLHEEVFQQSIKPLYLEQGWLNITRHLLSVDLDIFNDVVDILNLTFYPWKEGEVQTELSQQLLDFIRQLNLLFGFGGAEEKGPFLHREVEPEERRVEASLLTLTGVNFWKIGFLIGDIMGRLLVYHSY